MTMRRYVRPISGIALLALSFTLPATPARAERTMTFEVSGKYEDNVTGIARDNPNIGADISHGGGQTIGGVHLKGEPDLITCTTGTCARAAGKQGDFSTTLYADIGTRRDLGERTSLLLLVSAKHTAYNKFSELDFTIGTLSAGIGHRFTDAVSGRLEASVAWRDVKTANADSTAIGLTASLKERIGQSFWLREAATMEQSSAKDAVFDYTGIDASIRAGYDLSARSSLSAGYSYLQRDFTNSPVNTQTSVQAASLDWSLDLSDKWSILAGYDHEWVRVRTDAASASAGNNVYSVGVRYDY